MSAQPKQESKTQPEIGDKAKRRQCRSEADVEPKAQSVGNKPASTAFIAKLRTLLHFGFASRALHGRTKTLKFSFVLYFVPLDGRTTKEVALFGARLAVAVSEHRSLPRANRYFGRILRCAQNLSAWHLSAPPARSIGSPVDDCRTLQYCSQEPFMPLA